MSRTLQRSSPVNSSRVPPVTAANRAALITDPSNGMITATLPFAGVGGPAALTLRGLASGGNYGFERGALRVDVPGLLVVSPNSNQSLPIVWLQGDPTRKPSYEFYTSSTHRLVCYNSSCALAGLGAAAIRTRSVEAANTGIFSALRKAPLDPDAEDSTVNVVSARSADLGEGPAAVPVCVPAATQGTAMSLACEALPVQ